MAELALHQTDFDRINARLVVIGTGKTKYFQEVRDITGYKELLLTDPSRQIFSFLGFSNSLSGIVGLGAGLKAISAFKQGFRQGSVQGNTLQLGGAVIVDPSDQVRFFYAAKKAGDHPGIADLLSAIKMS